MRRRAWLLALATWLLPAACTAITGLPDVPNPVGDAATADGSPETGEAQAPGDGAPDVDVDVDAGPEADGGPDADTGAVVMESSAGDSALEADAGPTPVTLLAHTTKNDNGSGLSTSPIDTTGATLIVLAECTYSTGTPSPPTDSQNNVWQALGAYGTTSAAGEIRMFYSYGPTTNPNHVFTDPDNDYNAMAVLAFSGTLATASVLDTATGATGADAATLGPGSVVPTQLGELIVSFACSGNTAAASGSIDGGFTLVEYLSGNASGSNAEDMGSAYLVAGSLAAVAPTWTFAGDTQVSGVIGAFKVP